MRTFIALELPSEVILEIVRIQDLLRKKTLFTGKITESQNLHLTLKFLGEISEEQVEEIKKRLGEIKISKEVFGEIGEIGVFSKDFIRIVWIKLDGKGIFNLQKEIDAKLLGLFPKEARFMSHITIARVKNIKDKEGFLKYLESINPKKIRFNVKSFFFKKSELTPEGPVYNNIQEFLLQ